MNISPRRLFENGYFPQSLRQAKIIILEILLCIPVVIIFAFLDLEKNISFSDSLLTESEAGASANAAQNLFLEDYMFIRFRKVFCYKNSGLFLLLEIIAYLEFCVDSIVSFIRKCFAWHEIA